MDAKRHNFPLNLSLEMPTDRFPIEQTKSLFFAKKIRILLFDMNKRMNRHNSVAFKLSFEIKPMENGKNMII